LRTAKRRFTVLLVGFFFAFNSCSTTQIKPLHTLEVIPENQATAIRPLIKIVNTPSKANPLLKLELSKKVEGQIFKIQLKEEEKITKECNYKFKTQMASLFVHGVTFGVFLFLAPLKEGETEKMARGLAGCDPNPNLNTEIKEIKGEPEATGVLGTVNVPWSQGEVEIKINNKVEKKIIADLEGRVLVDLGGLLNQFEYLPNELDILLTAKIAEQSAKETLIIPPEISRELYAKSIDMLSAQVELPPYPVAKIFFEKTKGIIDAGSSDLLVVEIKNEGKGTTSQLKARIESPDSLFNGKELFFGKIGVGQTRSWKEEVLIPLYSESKDIPIKVKFSEGNGFPPEDLETMVFIKGKAQPRLAYSYQVVDDNSGDSVGNGDGRIQKDEEVDLLFTIVNVGKGKTGNILMDITTPLQDVVTINKSQIKLEAVDPGEKIATRLTVSLTKTLEGDTLPIDLQIMDTDFQIKLVDKILLPLDASIPPSIIRVHKTLIIKERMAHIYGGAGEDTLVIAQIEKENQLVATGQLGDWYRVLVDKNDTGWISSHAVKIKTDEDMKIQVEPAKPTVIKIFQRAPPVIALANPSNGQTVSVDRVTLKGTVVNDRGIDRIEISVNSVVFEKHDNRDIVVIPASNQTQTTREFDIKVELREGENNITIEAYDVDGLSSTKTVMVNRIEVRGQVFAAVIGISDYKNIRPLQYADDDATAFYEYLTGDQGIPENNVVKLISRDATLNKIKNVLGVFLKYKAGKEDTVIIYFAGHGAVELKSNIPDGDGLEKYLLPFDAEPNSLHYSAMPMDEIKKLFRRIQAKRVIFIIDSCYSGSGGGRSILTSNKHNKKRGGLSDKYLDRLTEGNGRIILTASRANELSIEKRDLEHGVFTYYLLEALHGKGDTDGNRIVTVSEAYQYVSKMIPDATNQNQHPVMRPRELEGPIILGVLK
jgi:hypothetical protein